MVELNLKSVVKRYGNVQVVHGIDLNISSGEFCVFVGPSGCGKSTLLRMIAGLEAISDGTIEIDGQVVNDIPAANRGLAMVFQSYALYPHMSVKENLSFGLENLRMDRAEIEERVGAAAKMLQIDQLLDRRPGQLSGGQRQRVAIGRTVVREPKVFLFDEPLSNLDAELRVAMRGEIAALHKRLGNTMVYVTHDQVEAMTMADKIAVLRAGQVEQYGAPLELYNRPANKFVAGFIGSPRMNFVVGQVQGVDNDSIRVEIAGHQLSLDASSFASVSQGQDVVLGVRPNQLSVSEDGFIDLHITAVEQLGGESYLFGTSSAKLLDDDTLRVQIPGQTRHAPGQQVKLGATQTDIHLFDADGLSLRL